MVLRPCLMCGKDVEAEGGQNTVYNRADDAVYACHSGRAACDGAPGAYDTAVKWQRLARMSPEARARHRVPAEVPPPRRRSWFRRR
jgi:hypothetical protein